MQYRSSGWRAQPRCSPWECACCAERTLSGAKRVTDAHRAALGGATRFVVDGNRMYAELAFRRPDGSTHRALAFVDMGSPSMMLTDALYNELQLDQRKAARLQRGCAHDRGAAPADRQRAEPTALDRVGPPGRSGAARRCAAAIRGSDRLPAAHSSPWRRRPLRRPRASPSRFASTNEPDSSPSMRRSTEVISDHDRQWLGVQLDPRQHGQAMAVVASRLGARRGRRRRQ